MKIQLNTDKNIQGTEALEAFVSEKIEKTLKHLVDHVTRVEVHLSDENAHKGGPDDILCKMEARVEGQQPVIVSSKSDEKEKALNDAAEKLKSTLSSIVDKRKN